jgi:hypothetical protein
MIRMIHAATGVEIWVSENRLPVALARGHRLADEPEPVKPEPEKKPASRPAAKKTAKK